MERDPVSIRLIVKKIPKFGAKFKKVVQIITVQHNQTSV